MPPTKCPLDRGLDPVEQVRGGQRIGQRRAQDVGERLTEHVTARTQPPERGQPVRAHVEHPGVLVEAEQPVADARTGLAVADQTGSGERPVRDHHGQVGRRLQIGQLQLAGPPDRGQVGVAGQHGHHGAVEGHRNGFVAHRHVIGPVRITLAADAALGHGHAQRTGPLAATEITDPVR